MIVVTGAAGFIGSNLIRGLNATGRTDIIAVDDLSDGTKFHNLVDYDFLDYLDKDEFRSSMSHRLSGVELVFHQGACSDTREWDGRFMLENNYAWSRSLLEACIENDVAFIYASSAAVYGGNRSFIEKPQFEQPVNVYGYSKLLFDRYARRMMQGTASQIAGLRYFNVYGPGEQHKGAMASVIFQLHRQLLESGTVKLFKGSGGYADGEQRRDFVHIDDVVDVNLWFMNNHRARGIFNVGTGSSRSFNDIARQLIDRHARGRVQYVDFPRKICRPHTRVSPRRIFRHCGRPDTANRLPAWSWVSENTWIGFLTSEDFIQPGPVPVGAAGAVEPVVARCKKPRLPGTHPGAVRLHPRTGIRAAGNLGSRGIRGRGAGVERAGETPAQRLSTLSGVADDYHANGRGAGRVRVCGCGAASLPALRPAPWHLPVPAPDQSAGADYSGDGNLAEPALLLQAPRHPRDPGQCQAVSCLIPRLPQVQALLGSCRAIVESYRRPERCRRRSFPGAGSGPCQCLGSRQPEVRHRGGQ